MKISRIEIIDSTGRVVVKYGDFTLSFQDDDRTLKVFVDAYQCKTSGCDNVAEDKVEYCSNHAPYFSGGMREEKRTEKIGNIKI